MNKFNYLWNLGDLRSVESNGKKVFSCFSCGGGSSMGYKLAGYTVIGNCEIDPRMQRCYTENLHPKYSFTEDIRLFNERTDLPDELYGIDILDGSPPCSVFSMAGGREDGWNVEKTFREGQKKQRLDDLFLVFVDTVKKLNPKVVVAENVRGLITGHAKGYVKEIIHALDDVGYGVQIFLLNSAFMGVPQKRERCFFIAQRKGKEKKINLQFDGKTIPFGKIREEHGKAELQPMASELMKFRKKGDKDLSDISMRIRGKKAGYTLPIVDDDEVCPTITSSASIYRMCDGKQFTDKDILTVQTFPQDYDFCGESVKYICGMSVPPVMMANIASEIYEQVLKEQE